MTLLTFLTFLTLLAVWLLVSVLVAGLWARWQRAMDGRD